MIHCAHYTIPGIGEFWVERDLDSFAHRMQQVIQEDDGQLTIYAGDLLILFTPVEWRSKNGTSEEERDEADG